MCRSAAARLSRPDGHRRQGTRNGSAPREHRRQRGHRCTRSVRRGHLHARCASCRGRRRSHCFACRPDGVEYPGGGCPRGNGYVRGRSRGRFFREPVIAGPPSQWLHDQVQVFTTEATVKESRAIASALQQEVFIERLFCKLPNNPYGRNLMRRQIPSPFRCRTGSRTRDSHAAACNICRIVPIRRQTYPPPSSVRERVVRLVCGLSMIDAWQDCHRHLDTLQAPRRASRLSD